MNNTVSDAVRASGLEHIAFIMDGNGRWANSRSLPRESGHSAGAANFKKIVRYCKDIGIKCCTVYAFSTENIKRPKAEVDALFRLLLSYISEADEEDEIEFRFIGEPGELSEKIGRRAAELERKTKGRQYRINIAFNYGGRAEIVSAVNKLIKQGAKSVTEEDISGALYTSDCSDPDLIIRTGKEMRISNFLLWQCAYSELYFSEKMWPELSADDIDMAVLEFASRHRRWGGLDGNK